ncbi:MAG: acyl-CoA thioesterase [Akkermansiaceae bacterium]|jgi:acyl-CoA thioester hydrolase|nr:acyl-CoA thioesterase [Akkermansiaceae bacterium]MBJ7395159.1 acyl-CoA thioesterase [Akkermansiaceae bacterium]MBJ7423422.1 acyl-CoA thioesterase [Akkermansiaceae bacterium]
MENPLHRQTGEIAFGDTDASGWMHFPNIFKYVEVAEHAFLRSRGILVFDREEGGWPRIKVSCEYKRPFRCGDKYEVLLAISGIGGASLSWNFEMVNAAGEIAAFGIMVNVRVDQNGRPKMISASERASLA